MLIKGATGGYSIGAISPIPQCPCHTHTPHHQNHNPHRTPAHSQSGDATMTSSNGTIFRVTGPLWGEFTGHRWIPLTKASDAELLCLLWSAPEQTFEKTIETPVIWDAIALIMTSLQGAKSHMPLTVLHQSMYQHIAASFARSSNEFNRSTLKQNGIIRTKNHSCPNALAAAALTWH